MKASILTLAEAILAEHAETLVRYPEAEVEDRLRAFLKRLTLCQNLNEKPGAVTITTTATGHSNEHGYVIEQPCGRQ